jgi:superfamily II DNA/RNA helicase
MKFADLGLSPEVLRAVEDAGYTQPTPIQEQAIPWVLQGRDILGCAQTGTGKTAGFTLPMIEILAQGRARARMPRSLILEPTRELAAQVAENFEIYGKHHKLSMALLIGGESFIDQIKKLDRGVDVLIATPGRMIDLFERGNILLSDIKVFVIDEADRMLDMGFIPDIERIVALLPKLRQTLFFSATMPPEIKRLADSFLMNPKEVSVAPPASPAENVTQAMTIVQPIDKRKALRHLLRTEDVKNALIFSNRKRDVAILHRSLLKSRCWCAAMSPPAASTLPVCPTSSTSTFRFTPKTMSTGSAAPAAPDAMAAPSLWQRRKKASRFRPSIG